MHKVAIPRNIAKGWKAALLENAPLTCQWCEVEVGKVRFVYYSGIQTGSKEHRKTSNLFCSSARKGSPPQTSRIHDWFGCLINPFNKKMQFSHFRHRAPENNANSMRHVIESIVKMPGLRHLYSKDAQSVNRRIRTTVVLEYCRQNAASSVSSDTRQVLERILWYYYSRTREKTVG